MVHAHWRWCRKNPVKAGAVCFHILSWVWTMTDTEHTRDARDVRDTRDPNMRCCVTLFGLTSPRQQFDSNCDTWSGKVMATVSKIARWRCVEQCKGVQGLFRDDAYEPQPASLSGHFSTATLWAFPDSGRFLSWQICMTFSKIQRRGKWKVW